MAREDIERHRHADLERARGELPALCVGSPTIHQLTLAARDQQAEAIATAITRTNPAVHPAVSRAHAAALVSVFQMIVDRLGRSVLDGSPPRDVADDLAPTVEIVFADLDRHFHNITSTD